MEDQRRADDDMTWDWAFRDKLYGWAAMANVDEEELLVRYGYACRWPRLEPNNIAHQTASDGQL